MSWCLGEGVTEQIRLTACQISDFPTEETILIFNNLNSIMSVNP